MKQEEVNENSRALLRQQMLTSRSELTLEQVASMSSQIVSRLDQLAPLRHARCIMGFASIKNEIDLAFWMGKEMAQGKTLLLPRVEKSGQLAAVEFKGWEHTAAGSFGIREPLGPPFDPQLIDVVLVPGLVFDAQGYRLGYGKGYYDRFLPRLRKEAFCCGLCYDFQMVDDVLPHPADVPVDWILTERSELAKTRQGDGSYAWIWIQA